MTHLSARRRRASRALVALFTSCFATTAWAGALDDNSSFQKAQALYAELEFEQAIFALEQAALDERLSPAERAQVLAWLGLCHAQARRAEAAARHFEAAVLADPSVTLPSFAPPAVVAQLEVTRAKRTAEATTPVEAAPASAPEQSSTVEPATTMETAEPLTALTLAAAGSGAGGIAAAAAGTLFVVLAASATGVARSTESYQDEARAAALAANVEMVAATVSFGAAGAALIAAATFAALEWSEQ